MNEGIDAYVSAIIKSRILVEERLLAIALLAGAESLTVEFPVDKFCGHKRRITLKLGRRKQARAMSIALTTAKAWREELERKAS